jgi:hypothetical protein
MHIKCFKVVGEFLIWIRKGEIISKVNLCNKIVIRFTISIPVKQEMWYLEYSYNYIGITLKYDCCTTLNTTRITKFHIRCNAVKLVCI